MTDTTTDSGEDEWVVPTRWWGKALPVRGHGPVPRERVDPVAAEHAERSCAAATGFVVDALGNPDSDPDLVVRGRAALAGDPDPLGQAVLAVLMHSVVDHQHSGDLLDLWVTRFGVRGTARIVASTTNLGVVRSPAPPGLLPYQGRPGIGVLAPGELSGTAAPGSEISGSYTGFQLWPWHARLRKLLAALPDDDYAATVTDLAAIRGRSRAVDAMVTYLLPTERDWIDEVVANLPPRRYPTDHDTVFSSLFTAVTTPEEAEALCDRFVEAPGDRDRLHWLIGNSPTSVYSLACRLGPAAVPLLAEVVDGNLSAKNRSLIYTLVAHLPSDAAFRMLLDRLGGKHVEPAVLTAADRYPRRALRMFTERASGDDGVARTTQRLLDDHVRTHPDLGPPAGTPVAADAPAITPDDTIPPLLLDPPWVGYRRPKPLVVPITATPTPLGTVWEDGERDRWMRAEPVHPLMPGPGWPAYLRRLLKHPRGLGVEVFAQAPIELVRPYFDGARPDFVWKALPDLQRILGRFDADAIDYVLAAVQSTPVGHTAVLLPVRGAAVSTLMAQLCTRRSTRPAARDWLLRHADSAAHDLIPAALGRAGKQRTAADTALRLLGAAGRGDTVRAAAATFGPDASAAIEAILTADPLRALPARMPTLPAWLRVELLPPLHPVGRGDALPADATAHLCLMGALCEPDEVYAGLPRVAADLDAASLAGWARALFEQWRHAEYPAAQGWILTLQGLVGDDETVRALTPLIRAWPGQSAHKRAVAGLDALAAIGTDTALSHLHGIAEKLTFPVLKATAAEKIEQIAHGLGLTADQLGDRLVPTLGLDDPDTLFLDYGPRLFRIEFDEHLRPTLRDAHGALRKALPRPGPADDPDLAPAAHARFTTLRKTVKPVAAAQLTRLERAMLTRRRWPAREFRELFVEHPLLIHLVRRLVWGLYDAGDDRLTGALRVTADGRCTDLDGTETPWDDSTLVGLAHPCDLDGILPAWTGLFAADGIDQPFAQLHRGVHTPTADEHTDTRLARFENHTVPTAALLGLERHGWQRESPQDAGIQTSTSRTLSGGGTVTLAFHPGIVVGEPGAFPEQRIVDVNVAPRPLGQIHPVDASEVLCNLFSLVGSP